MTKLTVLRAANQPVPEVIAVLNDALERARNGEIIGIGILCACDGRADSSVYAIGDGTIAQLVLAGRRLERRLLDIGED